MKAAPIAPVVPITLGSSTSCRRAAAALALVAAVVWCATPVRAQGQGTAVQRSRGGAEFALARDADRVVLRYSEHPGELAGDLPGRSLEVRGDGRIRIRIPAHMKQAGEYELDVGASGVDALVGELLDEGIAEFDAEDVRRRRRDVAQQRRAEPGRELHFRSDETQLTLELELDRYRGRGSAAPLRRDVALQLRYRGLREDARRYPEIEALQGLARAQARLRAVMADSRRRRVTSGSGASQ